MTRFPVALFFSFSSKDPKVKLSIHSAEATCVLDHVGPLRSMSLSVLSISFRAIGKNQKALDFAHARPSYFPTIKHLHLAKRKCQDDDVGIAASASFDAVHDLPAQDGIQRIGHKSCQCRTSAWMNRSDPKLHKG